MTDTATAERPLNIAADLASNMGADEAAPALPPLTPAGAAATIEDQLAILNKQMSALIALQGGQMQLLAGAIHGKAVTDETLQATAAVEEMPAAPINERRVRIVLEDNDAIPPGGQFVQVDGRPFLLVPGYEVEAPVSLLDVLDHAVMSVPVKDENHTVIGYRDRLRLPYRVVRHAEQE